MISKKYNFLEKDGFYHERFYKNIFDEIPCYVSVQDRSLKIVALNKKFREAFGDKVGSFCYSAYKYRNSPCIECPVLLSFKDACSHSTEEVVTTLSGIHHNVITWTSPIYDEFGKVSLVVEISTDITSIRKLQDRLTSLGLMISSVSHGLRGMLTAIDGGLYKLETGIKKNNIQRTTLGFSQLKRVIARMRKTILEILYYAKSREFEYKKISTDQLLININEDFEKKAKNNNIRFEIVNLATNKSFMGDYTWIYMAISNFIENAIDACTFDRQKKEHSIKINIHKTSSKCFEILIQDNGVGMQNEIKNKLFTLFFSSKGSQGTGLGLFISNQIISQHNGSIDIETKEKEGTTVKIRLPKDCL